MPRIVVIAIVLLTLSETALADDTLNRVDCGRLYVQNSRDGALGHAFAIEVEAKQRLSIRALQQDPNTTWSQISVLDGTKLLATSRAAPDASICDLEMPEGKCYIISFTIAAAAGNGVTFEITCSDDASSCATTRAQESTWSAVRRLYR